MNGLQVGNHSQSTSSAYSDIDLSTPPVDPTPVEPTEPVTPAEPIVTSEPIVPVEPTEPVTPTEPVEPTIPTEPSSLTPNIPSPEEGSVFNEDKTFEYLSEKLGRDIKSLDDLKQDTPVNPLENDPYLKELSAWRKKTGRPIEDWYKYQKDYSNLSDLEVAREFLQHEYPSFTKSEIDAELKEFQADDMDDDSDISKKSRKLKKYSTQGRQVLNQLVSDLGDVGTLNLPEEVQQDLALAKQVKENHTANQQAMVEYNSGISKAASLTDTIKLSLSDSLTVDYKIPEETKKGLPNLVNEVPHWKNEDGSWNHEAVVKDAVLIKHHKEMIRLAFEQGKNAGNEEIIQQTNNSTLAQPSPMTGNQPTGKGIEIEGYDDFVGKSGMKLRFNK